MKRFFNLGLVGLLTSCASVKTEPYVDMSANESSKRYRTVDEIESEQSVIYSAAQKEEAKLDLPFNLQSLAPNCSSGYFCGPLDERAINKLPGDEKEILVDYLHKYYPEYGY